MLGPAQAEEGWAYNFSQGPKLAATPLFLAAVLPLRFVTAGERREDLLSFLLSPFYGGLGRYRAQTAPWDRLWRAGRIDRGWLRLQQAVARDPEAHGRDLLPRLHRLWEALQAPGNVRQWRGRLEQAWNAWGYGPSGMLPKAAPRAISTRCSWNWRPPWGSNPWRPTGCWRGWSRERNACRCPAPGSRTPASRFWGCWRCARPGVSRVFCLGMNSGALPPPPRSLPLLSAAERRLVLGGTYRSQHEFSRELYDTLLGAAPELILSRPRVADDEERVGSPLYLGPWEPQEMAVLSRPHRAWLRSPAIRAAFSDVGAAFGGYGNGPLSLPLAPQYSLSKAATALGCPCHSLWNSSWSCRNCRRSRRAWTPGSGEPAA